MAVFRRLLKDRSGATSIEYCLVASLIAMAIITTLGLVGNSVTSLYNALGAAVAR